jgi:hypothetical protein
MYILVVGFVGVEKCSGSSFADLGYSCGGELRFACIYKLACLGLDIQAK